MTSTRDELSRVRSEYDKHKKDTTQKIDTIRKFVEEASQPVNAYIIQNKGSKSPLKKLACYKTLKDVDGRLQLLQKEAAQE